MKTRAQKYPGYRIVYFPVEKMWEIWRQHKFIAGPFLSSEAAEKWITEQ